MKIVITLVNAATGEVIGVSEQPADELPDTFTGGTELTIGSRTWNVVGAEPASSAERTRTGALRLTLREPQVVDPQRVRYSMSSICDELPPVADEEADGDATLTLHEDLWRDIELISARHQAAIDANIAAIDRIERDAAGAAGYGDLHLRVEPSSPLAGVELWLDELLSQLSGTRMPDGVALREGGVAAAVVDGFALVLPTGPRLYGWAPRGRIRALGVDMGASTWPEFAAGADGAVITELMRRHQLVLVDWRGRQCYSAQQK